MSLARSLLRRLFGYYGQLRLTVDRHRQPVLLYCDTPRLDQRAAQRISGDYLEVSGWSVAAAGLEGVRIYIDDQLVGRATHGLLRPDFSLLGSADQRSVGFHFVWPIPSDRNGRRRLRIEASDRSGNRLSREGLVLFCTEPSSDYERWLLATTDSAADLRCLQQQGSRLAEQPLFSLLVVGATADGEPPSPALDSLRQQVYPHWEARPVGSDVESWNRALATARGDFVAVVDSGDILHPSALLEAAYLQNRQPLDLIYSDEDRLVRTRSGQLLRYAPSLKPDYSPDLLWSRNYIGRLWLGRTALVKQLGGFRPSVAAAAEYDLLLRLCEQTSAIGHIPRIVYSRAVQKPSAADALLQQQAEQQALRDACRRAQLTAEVLPLPAPGVYRVRRALPAGAQVTAIIPTRGNLALLGPLLTSMAERSTRRPDQLLLLIADRDPPSAELRALCQRYGATIVCYPTVGAFNWSRVNNLGAAQAHGDYLLFLNDDIEVYEPTWLEALIEQAQRPEVAIVGAKLLYPSGLIQHAGITLTDQGGGGRHLLRGLPDDPALAHGALFSIRECAAVTGACMLIRRALFAELGRFDEAMELVCSDSDLCLRAWQRGYRVLFTPFAVLTHTELATRKDAPMGTDVQRFWVRWGELLRRGDPFLNPNLSRDSDLPEIDKSPLRLSYAAPADSAPALVAESPLRIAIAAAREAKGLGWPPSQLTLVGRLLVQQLGVELVELGSSDPETLLSGCALLLCQQRRWVARAAAQGVPALLIDGQPPANRQPLPAVGHLAVLHPTRTAELRHLHPEQVFAAVLRLLSHRLRELPLLPVTNCLLRPGAQLAK